jgi:SAM-dependent methyltransferase
VLVPVSLKPFIPIADTPFMAISVAQFNALTKGPESASRRSAGTDRPEASCRGCGKRLSRTFIDLGSSPLANSYLEPPALCRMEPFYPLHAFVCERCFLVQLESFEAPDAIFSDYAYFSSYSSSWLKHAECYVEMMMRRRDLGPWSRVVEIASNDGYLLQYFLQRGVGVLGIEPAVNVAKVARERGIRTETVFFGLEQARRIHDSYGAADLIVGNNVLAHVPDLNDFVAGVAALLAGGGLATFEFPHLLRLIDKAQFDTIYHEHFSYFSLLAVEPVFARHGLEVVDVEELSTHGGSLRLYVSHRKNIPSAGTAVGALREQELAAGLSTLNAYSAFAAQVARRKRALLHFLITAADEGKQVVGYGAPAKGNTLLNYCGVGPDLLAYTVDRSPHKQGRFLPGSRIPIFAPEKIVETRPDVVLILPWNLKDEIAGEMRVVRSWGGTFVVPIPEMSVVSS